MSRNVNNLLQNNIIVAFRGENSRQSTQSSTESSTKDHFFQQLREENNKLLVELCFERSLNQVLDNIRNYSLVLMNSCKCSHNSDILRQLKQFNSDFEALKVSKHLNPNVANESELSEIESNIVSIDLNNTLISEQNIQNIRFYSDNVKQEVIDVNIEEKNEDLSGSDVKLNDDLVNTKSSSDETIDANLTVINAQNVGSDSANKTNEDLSGSDVGVSDELTNTKSSSDETNEPKVIPMCDECGECFESELELEEHMNSSHKKGKQFVCNKCEQSFETEMCLEMHTNCVHKSSETTNKRPIDDSIQSSDNSPKQRRMEGLARVETEGQNRFGSRDNDTSDENECQLKSESNEEEIEVIFDKNNTKDNTIDNNSSSTLTTHPFVIPNSMQNQTSIFGNTVTQLPVQTEPNFKCYINDCKHGFHTWAAFSEHLSKVHFVFVNTTSGQTSFIPSNSSVNSNSNPFPTQTIQQNTFGPKVNATTGQTTNFSNSFINTNPNQFPTQTVLQNSFVPKEPKKQAMTGQKSWNCSQCFRTFKSEKFLTNHIQKMHQKVDKPYKSCCNKCGQQFHTFDDKYNHLLRFHSEDMYECVECKERFLSETSYQTHRKTHSKTDSTDPLFSCYSCKEQFCSRIEFEKHVVLSLGNQCDNKLDFWCDWGGCGKKYKDKQAMYSHLLGHTGRQPLSCDYKGCNKLFSTKTHLTCHQLKYSRNERQTDLTTTVRKTTTKPVSTYISKKVPNILSKPAPTLPKVPPLVRQPNSLLINTNVNTIPNNSAQKYFNTNNNYSVNSFDFINQNLFSNNLLLSQSTVNSNTTLGLNTNTTNSNSNIQSTKQLAMKCIKCQFITQNMSSLINHMKTHESNHQSTNQSINSRTVQPLEAIDVIDLC